NSLIGIKYRFLGDGEDFGISIYPQVILNNPTSSVDREIVERGPQFLFPMEAKIKLGPVQVSGEGGYWFVSRGVPHSWIRGVVIGHEFPGHIGLYGELYDQADVRRSADQPANQETTVGIGGRLPLTKTAKLIGMAGRSIVTSEENKGHPTWIGYFGVQFEFGSEK